MLSLGLCERAEWLKSSLYLSDRARSEFSNASIMMWLSNHEKKSGLGAE